MLHSGCPNLYPNQRSRRVHFSGEAALKLLFSHLTVSNSLWPRGLQHTRLPSPSLSLQVCSTSCPLSWYYHPTISSLSSISSSHPLLLLPSVFPRIRVFSNKLALRSSGQSIEVSVSVLLMNIQGWFTLGLTGLISSLSKELSRVFSRTAVQKHQFFGT